jgi:hypothetical protein
MRQWKGKEWRRNRKGKHGRKENLGIKALQIEEAKCIFMVNKWGYIVRWESRCAFRLRYVDLAVSIEPREQYFQNFV